MEEQQALEKEKIRQKKEAERAETKRKNQVERDRKKAIKVAEKAEKAKAAKEKKQAEEEDAENKTDDDADGEGGGVRPRKRQVRRVRGFEELGETDHPVLVNRFAEFEMNIVTELPDFLDACLKGEPVVLRARRSPVKKILEYVSFDPKTAMSQNTRLMAEMKDFISEFAGICEQDPNKLKYTKAASEEAQNIAEALGLDVALQDHLEKLVKDQGPGTGADSTQACLVDRGDFATLMDSRVKACKDKCQAENAGKDTLAGKEAHQASQELALWSQLQLIGHQKGKQYDGVIGGFFPNIQYQMEGSRAVAIVSMRDVI